ncbi:MAG TPA: helicase C-terminal domain-containing protein [Phycisphaerae bacterium]|nr:helicase C-terminal domain-containing protein [Phycisphaerae bacterium]
MTLSAADILAPGGLIEKNLPNYEYRHEQLQMSQAVESAFLQKNHLIVEAGTGVGKSFAYLAPAIIAAAENKRRIVISTFTISLQEQLIRKDLPFLHDILPVEFSAVLGKGRRNYLCFRRLAMTMKGRDKIFASDRQQDQLDLIADWAMRTSTGEYQELDFPVDAAVWNRVCSEPGSCRGGKCPSYHNCHLQSARRKMLAADIVVVNHAMFFADLALRQDGSQLIGPYDIAVIDEAHTAEDVAGEHFGCHVSSANIGYLLKELYNDETDRGILALAGDAEAISTVKTAAAATDDYFERLAEYHGDGITTSGRFRKEEIIPDTLTQPLKRVADALARLARSTKDDDQQAELSSLALKAMEFSAGAHNIIFQENEGYAYWKTSHYTSRGNAVHTLASAPIDVSDILSRVLFSEVQSVILTSATLATARGNSHGFEYIRKRLGVYECSELLLASPFDYRTQAKLYIETRLGDPNDLESFVPEAARAIGHYALKSAGRCFVLATSYSLLNALADELTEFCRLNSLELLVQGQDLQRTAMLEHFRANPSTILLGTRSFWQGVDVAGDALTNVIIPKLPFAVPDEPIIEARMDAIRTAGGNPFTEYQLPQAIIQFKQGFGRLIRSKTDTGFVVVLDHRIITRRYGRSFINALPEIDIIRDYYSGTE